MARGSSTRRRCTPSTTSQPRGRRTWLQTTTRAGGTCSGGSRGRGKGRLQGFQKCPNRAVCGSRHVGGMGRQSSPAGTPFAPLWPPSGLCLMGCCAHRAIRAVWPLPDGLLCPPAIRAVCPLPDGLWCPQAISAVCSPSGDDLACELSAGGAEEAREPKVGQLHQPAGREK